MHEDEIESWYEEQKEKLETEYRLKLKNHLPSEKATKEYRLKLQELLKKYHAEYDKYLKTSREEGIKAVPQRFENAKKKIEKAETKERWDARIKDLKDWFEERKKTLILWFINQRRKFRKNF